MPRKRMARHHLVNFSSKEFPKIMPWFEAQYNQKLSIYLLIRMAQRVGGNHDWPSVMQNMTSDLVAQSAMKHQETDATPYPFQVHQHPAQPMRESYDNERHQFLKRMAAQSSSATKPSASVNSQSSAYSMFSSQMSKTSEPKGDKSHPKVSTKELKGLNIKGKW